MMTSKLNLMPLRPRGKPFSNYAWVLALLLYYRHIYRVHPRRTELNYAYRASVFSFVRRSIKGDLHA